MVRFLRNRGKQPRKDEVVRREVIELEGRRDGVRVDDEQLQREIRNVMKDQEPGRYRVKVRRRIVRQ